MCVLEQTLFVWAIHTFYLFTECEKAFNGSSGGIYWPKMNILYFESCTWTIEVPASNVIKAELVGFSLKTFDGWAEFYVRSQYYIPTLIFYKSTLFRFLNT